MDWKKIKKLSKKKKKMFAFKYFIEVNFSIFIRVQIKKIFIDTIIFIWILYIAKYVCNFFDLFMFTN